MKNTNENPESAAALDSDSNVIEMFPEVCDFPSGDLGKIQDILFGEQLRASNQQMALLQSRTQEKLNSIVQDFDDHVLELTKKMDRILEGLNLRMEDQQKLLQANDDKLSQEMRKARIDLEDRIAKADQSSVQQQMKLASDIKECKDQLVDSIKTTKEDLKSHQAQGLADLHNAKIDKDMLSTLFLGVAKELSKGDDSEKPLNS